MKLISMLVAAVAVAMCVAVTASPGSNPPTRAVRLHAGMQTPGVAELQMFLRMSKQGNFFHYGGGYTGYFGAATVVGLKSWQKSAGRQATGWVVIGSSAWNQLRRETMRFNLPAGIDPQAVGGARQDGWAVDASKQTNMLYLLNYQRYRHKVVIALSTPTSFGGCNSDGCFATPNGAFPVIRKAGKNEVSHQWKDSQGNWAPMPYSLYLGVGDGGTAVHYDPLGNSHQCVHVPDWNKAKYMYYHVPIGALVVIHG